MPDEIPPCELQTRLVRFALLSGYCMMTLWAEPAASLEPALSVAELTPSE